MQIKIAGVWEAKLIPLAGVSLANTGLTAATLYYVYAFDNATVLTLEAVTTVPTMDTDTGLQIKTGDASRSLVGLVFMDAGSPGTFADGDTKRYTASFFNRRTRAMVNNFTANRTTTGAIVEVNTEIRCTFVTWGDEIVRAQIHGSTAGSATNGIVATHVGFDGVTDVVGGVSYFPSVANQTSILQTGGGKVLAAGNHFATLAGRSSNAATATWHGSGTYPETGTNNERTTLRVFLMI